jgi:amino acid permease
MFAIFRRHPVKISINMPTTHAQLSFWVTVAFTLNYILGSGFLTLPWGFEKTGVILGIIVLAIFGFFSMLSILFILETMYRGQKYLKYVTSAQRIQLSPMGNFKGYVSIEVSSHSETDPNQDRSPIHEALEDNDIPPENNENRPLAERKLELIELTSMFLGPIGEKIYLIIITVYMYGTLWAYSTVFGTSFASHLSIGTYSYEFYLLIFALSVVPLSVMEFSEQVTLQVTLSIFRVIMVSIMVVTCLIAEEKHDNEFNIDNSTNNNPLLKFAPGQLYFLLPVAAYAYIFHHSIPSLADTCRDKDQLTHVFGVATVVSMLAYSLVGACIAVYFKDQVLSQSNLNWINYRGYSSSSTTPMYAHIISFFVVLFPAVDVASAFPLNAYTLGNSLMSTYYGKDVHKYISSRSIVCFFRVIAALPPILGACLISDLGKITDWTGLTAFGLAFIYPALLTFMSHRILLGEGLPTVTPYSSWWTSVSFQIVLGVSGLLLFLGVAVCLMIS